MKIVQLLQVSTHIITGFLGAGKTTVLQHLLKQKPEHEVWAVLINEFGQIGVDQALLPQQQGYEVRELLGGCLCCASQLPMHIALSRLLTDVRPDRLFIEPTGLGHPRQLIEQLSEPHWTSSLLMKKLVTVVDGSRLHEMLWLQHTLYLEQIKAAEILLVSHADQMSEQDRLALASLQQQELSSLVPCYEVVQGAIELAQIDLAHTAVKRFIQPLLYQQKNQTMPTEGVIKTLPYHYVEQSQGFEIAGWKLPSSWSFELNRLLDVLYDLSDWLRIKAIFRTNQGWIYFNCTPNQFNYKSGEAHIDNRIEIIVDQTRDWHAFEAELLSAVQE